MRRINSADLVKYNANIRGKNVGDCVKRALSLATNSSYNDISKELLEAMHEIYKHPDEDEWKRPTVFNHVIAAHGGSRPLKPKGDVYTLGDFVDNVLGHEGTFLVTTGKQPGTLSHIVCIIDGKIYDSWDSSNQYVYNYYTFDDVVLERKSGLDIAKMQYSEVQDLLEDLNYADRLRDKASAMLSKKVILMVCLR